MTTGYQLNNQEGLYYLTLQVVKWIDIFTRNVYKDIIVDSLQFCQKNKDLTVFAYVIMSNHIHLLAQSQSGKISDTIRDFKSFTAKAILKEIEEGEESRKEWMLKQFEFSAKRNRRNSDLQFWTHENHAEEIYSDKFVEQKLEYIHMNPVKAGIVVNPEDYLYSSARNYAGLDSMMDVNIITTRWKTVR